MSGHADVGEFADIFSHVFVLPLIAYAVQHFQYLYLLLAATLNMAFNSGAYHRCALTGAAVCILPFEEHRLVDHASANYWVFIVLVYALPMTQKTLQYAHYRVMYCTILTVVHFNYYLLVHDDTYIWIAYGVLLVATFVIFFVWFYEYKLPTLELYNPRTGLIGVACAVVAFVFYNLEGVMNEHVAHTLWHSFGFVGATCLIVANDKAIVALAHPKHTHDES